MNAIATHAPAWFETIEELRRAPEWESGGVPVEMKQTHISVLLLGPNHVLKLKKPVNFGFLDYTTLEKRRIACEAEVRLNRRLCPHVYLGVKPVVRLNGHPRLSGAGPIIDYGVWMRRLPSQGMLDEMVRRETATEDVIDRVAKRLAEFHREAERGPRIDAFGDLAHIRRNWEENFTQTTAHVGKTISADSYGMLHEWVSKQLQLLRPVFHSRVHDKQIVDGHGDVRCESICVTDRVCFFDCVEFNDRFRCGDVASEVAFLAMDLDSLGRPDLGYYFTERYDAWAPDAGLWRLLPFYRCYRAYVRGKVLSFRLDEQEFNAAEKRRAAEQAAAFFSLARRYASPLPNPAVLMVGGLAGTGKTSVARALAGEFGFRVLPVSDVIPAEAIAELVSLHRGVVLDGSFLREADRAEVRRIASQAGAVARLIECRLPPALVRQRLEGRLPERSDSAWQSYSHQFQQFGPDAFESPGCERLTLDTRLNVADGARIAADWLRSC